MEMGFSLSFVKFIFTFSYHISNFNVKNIKSTISKNNSTFYYILLQIVLFPIIPQDCTMDWRFL